MPSRRTSTLRAEPVRSGLAMFWSTGERFWRIVNQPNFGAVLSQFDPRQIQFGAKFTL
jgi:hypothetical protein